MSYLVPKRISELAAIECDLDTPDKRDDNCSSKLCNLGCNRLPKRILEVDLEDFDSTELLDSEDDRNDNLDDRLNCALLNDSFILSPTKKLNLDDTQKENRKSTGDENNKQRISADSGVVSDPSGHHGSSNSSSNSSSTSQITTVEKKLDPPEDHLKIGYRPLKARTQLFPLSNSNLKEKMAPSVFQKAQPFKALSVSQQKQDEDEVKPAVLEPRRVAADSNVHETSDTQTPFKKMGPHCFATPSVWVPLSSFSTTDTALKKFQILPGERKEKPQVKILFTTPISRPPPGSLLESTPIELRKPPATNRKLSPIKEPSTEKEKSSGQLLTIKDVDYVVEEKIGAGGSSTVFLARKKLSGKEVAIKLVNLDGDKQVIEGYLNETKLLAKLQGNICVVSLFDYLHLPEKNILYMVMEKGESDLHKILQGYRTCIPLHKLMNYIYQMLQAVNYIHQNGVIHSDLKPANFLMVNGRLKLIDFGIASNIALDSTSIIKFSQAGTFNYISPEALIDTSGDSPSTHHHPKIRLSKKSDVWSLGCIFYLLLYKKTPFSHIKVIHQKITVLTNPKTVIDYPELPNFYPPILIEMVKKCLIYDPKERSSVADLLKYPFEMIISIEK